MPNILSMITEADRLSFSQNFSVNRNYLGDRLFPDVKTENLMAEYLRLANGANLPVMATVHAFDTEAQIGSRPAFDKVEVEKLLIKRKINQTERVRMLKDHGVYKDDEIVKYVFDDMRLMAEAVKTRSEVAKMEVLASGKMSIKENNLSIDVDYGVPTANVGYSVNAGASADIIGQIQTVVDAAAMNGYAITEIVTSTKVLRAMAANKAIQTLVFGAAGQGAYVSTERLRALFAQMFGITAITVNDSRYQYEKANGTKATARYFPEDKIAFISQSNIGRFGTGLWGVTPEETAYGPYSEKSQTQFITLTQWETPDPVAVWTKASGVFIPVLPDPNALYVATVTGLGG